MSLDCRVFRFIAAIALLNLMVLEAGAANFSTNNPNVVTPEWIEENAPPPPAFDKNRVLQLDMPIHVSVKVGVDPDTISVGASDSVVRYVMVMTSNSGNTYAVYEGIRCTTDEVKTYARWSASGKWNLIAEPKWQEINDNQPSPHAFIFARRAACPVHVAASKNEIVATLKGALPKSGGRNIYVPTE